MPKIKNSVLITLLIVGLTISAIPMANACGTPFWPKPPLSIRPIVFVHGGAGSGAQFESQAMRFTSNGYPPNYIAVHEYDSSSWSNLTYQQIVWAGLDQLIDSLLAETGADKVDLLGHSLGTSVCQGYLRSSPARAAKVAHYVNIDGADTPDTPGGVPTLALIAGKGWSAVPGRGIGGAINVTLQNQTHVEVATSAEAFVEMYKFFTGQEPLTKDIVPEPPGQIRIGGRVVYFPMNTGVEGATLEIWEVNSDTGMRVRKKPEAVYVLNADGAWGPLKIKAGAYYEFVVKFQSKLGTEILHYYREPFIRSDYLIRILVSPPGGVAYYADRSPNHSNILILRNKEFWGDQGVNNDILEINGVNIINSATCPVIKGIYRTGVIGIWVYDKGNDSVSNLTTPISYYYAQAFQTGVDLFIPAADPPNATISLVLTPRGGDGKTQVINVPNWASLTETVLHRIVVQFNDYVQDINSFQDYMRMWRP
ncbi:MAG: alpha/beta hydrolase [Candidatus Bathyarchaeia archaeon]